MAEIGEEIVGMIRGCIKTVTCGKKLSRNGRQGEHFTRNNTKDTVQSTTPKHAPVYTKVAYILGLRVSPSHRYDIKRNQSSSINNNGNKKINNNANVN